MKDDTALVIEALSGDPETFSPIIERYRDAVFAIALARLRDFHDAEDVAQDVFIEAFEHLNRLDDPHRLSAWLRSITIHRCIDYIRQKHDTICIDDIAEQLEAPEIPYAEIEQQELRNRVMSAIERLSKTQRETVALFYINGYSQEEVSRIQEVPIGTVKRRLHDARGKLKEEMIGVVEDVLKAEAPKEDFGERVFDILSRYHRATVTQTESEWDKIASELREIGTEGIEGFLKALKSPYFQTRRFALRMLPDSGQNQNVIEELLKKSLTDPNKEVRRTAFRSIADVMYDDENKRKELASCLLPLLTDRCYTLRSYIAWWLGDHNGCMKHVPLDRVVRIFLDEKNPRVRQNLEYLMRSVVDSQENDKDNLR